VTPLELLDVAGRRHIAHGPWSLKKRSLDDS